MIYDIYDHYSMSNQWLEQRIEVAKEEYVKVWTSQELPYYHQVYQGLSRYYDSNDSLAENESGWDKTIRFNRHCLNYLPIDLNCMLYKYERDFYRTALIFNNDYEANFWLSKSEQRASQINHLMWDRSSGLFYDYNFVDKKKASIRSLAAYFALWSGVANDFQAEKLKNNLLYFEHQGGLVTTDFLPEKYQNKNFLNFQWSYPNGWAPLHFIVVEGLKKYNYFEDANRIAMRWLKTNLAWFEQNDNFLEKYNVVNVAKQPAIGIYTSQIGFGWTNAVFERFCQDFIDF
jgi:alpha,alpha-trehalase